MTPFGNDTLASDCPGNARPSNVVRRGGLLANSFQLSPPSVEQKMFPVVEPAYNRPSLLAVNAEIFEFIKPDLATSQLSPLFTERYTPVSVPASRLPAVLVVSA